MNAKLVVDLVGHFVASYKLAPGGVSGHDNPFQIGKNFLPRQLAENLIDKIK